MSQHPESTSFNSTPERIPNYRHDGEPRALYWGPYRRRFNEIQTLIKPGEIISPESGIVVALVGNSTLLWNTFDLKNQDREPLAGVTYPGKSAHVDFTDSFNPQSNPDLNMLCDAIFGRKARRTDHLYITTLEKLEDAGYKTFYTPQPNNPLHLRIVHASQMSPNAVRDISRHEKEALMEVWRKIK